MFPMNGLTFFEGTHEYPGGDKGNPWVPWWWERLIKKKWIFKNPASWINNYNFPTIQYQYIQYQVQYQYIQYQSISGLERKYIFQEKKKQKS